MEPTPAPIAAPQPGVHARAVTSAIDRVVYCVARRWLLYLNSWLVAFLTVAVAAPVLMADGYGGVARAMYALHRPFCHQRADRSFFVLGEKMACCQRCATIYAGFLLFGLAFAGLRGRLHPLSWRGLLLFALPMFVDGITQATGLRESGWELRIITGALFATGAAWLALPHLETGFADIRCRFAARSTCLMVDEQERLVVSTPLVPPS